MRMCVLATAATIQTGFWEGPSQEVYNNAEY